MMFSDLSVFVAQPLLLDIRQRRFIVGARFAVEAVHLSYERLVLALERHHDSGNVSDSPLISEFFTDVWSIIDNSRRFQRLLLKFPVDGCDSITKPFVTRWSALKVVRDTLQHIDDDFKKAVFPDNHVYGTLWWIDSRYRLSLGKVHAHCVPAGPQANSKTKDGSFPVEIPLDAQNSIHSVTITAAGAVLPVSGLAADVVSTALELDKLLTSAVNDTVAKQKRLHPGRGDRLDLMAKPGGSYCVTFSVEHNQTS